MRKWQNDNNLYTNRLNTAHTNGGFIWNIEELEEMKWKNRLVLDELNWHVKTNKK